ncbi:MAG: hypothetical protein IKC84_01190, partial [Helicobacteraceae bacterium]|nr:hypothetical protein [Helicobacteraceae bacterium]
MRLFSQFLFVFLFLASIAYAAGGGRDETRVCINEHKVVDSSNVGGSKKFVNCVWISDLDKVTDGKPGSGSGSTISFKQDVLNDSNLCNNYGFYTCTGVPDRHSEIKFSNTAVYKPNFCTPQSKDNCFIKKTGGGTTPPEKPKPEKPADLIIEEINNIFGTGATPNVVYTRTTGSDLKVRMYHKNNAGSFGSGLKSATCTVSGSGGTTSASANWDFWGGGTYVFEVQRGLSKAGYYTLQCSGVDNSNNNVVSPSLRFYVAPASYTAELKITAHNGQSYTINSPKVTSNGATKKVSLSGKDIVQKVGSSLDIALSGSANTNSGGVDSGVNTSMQRLGEIQNVIQGLNAVSGTRVCQANAPTLPKDFKTSISNGNFSGTENFSFDDVYKGKMTMSYIDQDMKNIIDGEKARGGCSGNGTNHGKCPFPPTFEFSFDYLIVPDNFEIKVTTIKGSPIKVLYYGQGSSPANEGSVTLQVIPKGSANNSLKNFVNGCAAIDTELELNGADTSIVFIDPTSATTSSTTTLITAKDFTYQSNQAMANLQRVLSVQNTKNPWNPSMVAEPIKLGTSVNPLVYYAGKKNDNSYPQYNPSFDSLKDAIILRGRVNMIDTDNAGNYSTPPTTKVYYEFYCQTCDLSEINKITGAKKYVGSPTSAGWWIDTTFSTFNA